MTTAAPQRGGAYQPDGDRFPDTQTVIRRLAELAYDPNSAKQYARSVARDLAELYEAADLLDWRDLLKSHAKLPGTEFDLITKKVHDDRRQRHEALADAARQEQHRRDLADAEQSGRLIPGPPKPLPAARKLMETLQRTDDAYHLAHWRGDLYRWHGTHWTKEDAAALRRWIYLRTEGATYDAGPARGIVEWDPTPPKVDAVLDAITTAIIQRGHELDPDRAIACANGVYDLGVEALLPHTPRRFNLTSLPYGYDPKATCPTWLAFLADILDHDPEGQQFLKEWFGYVVSGRTDMQKMLSLVGPKRCGKGTVARVLLALLGQAAVASPGLNKLGGTFGEEGLIGKSLAILSDVRWTAQATIEAIPVLLAITGEDARTVDRKNRTPWHGTLGVRFMAMSNDVPNFSDPSGAAAGRMMHVEFAKSFFGREDHTLTGRLLQELPGILNWALDGLRDLNRSGRFTSPTTAADINEAVMRLSSSEYAFSRDECQLVADGSETIDDLYSRYRSWCHTEGKERIPPKEHFSRGMRSALGNQVQWDRPKVNGAKVTVCRGIRLNRAAAF